MGVGLRPSDSGRRGAGSDASLARRAQASRPAGLAVRAVFLEVDDDNVPARRLYARSAFREVGRRKGYYPRPSGSAGTALVLRRDLV